MTVVDMNADGKLYTESFGDYLKRHREASGLTIDSISKTTRISKRFLQAFEDNHVENFPDDAFAKGFLKVYARELGLESEEVLARYDQLKRSLIPTQIRELNQKRETKPEGFKDLTKVRWLAGGLTAAAVLGGLLMLGIVSIARLGTEETSSLAPPSLEDDNSVSPEIAPSQMIEPPLIQEPQTSPTAAQAEMAVPVKASLLVVTAAKDGQLTYRLDGKVAETQRYKAGDSQTISVQREIEIQFEDSSAFKLSYNGRPMDIVGTNVKLFNRHLFLKR